MPTEQPPSDATDIFSLSDRVLADKLQFVKEVRFSIYVLARRLMYPFKIGFGNWGSVWLCRPRVSNDAGNTKLAVKLVHRSKTTTTTAARVRSL
jgi:serine/threonine-protein kinase GIN4